MRLLFGPMEVSYRGRGESELPLHPRLLLLKADGSVCIHGDRGYKPLNYMTAPATVEEEWREDGLHLFVKNKKKEELHVHLLEVVFQETLFEGESEEPGHSKSTSERDLQEWLSQHMEVFGEEGVYRFLEREAQTGRGPVDLLLERGPALVAVEVKRSTSINTVGQVLRYRDALEEKHPGREIECVIAAFSFNKSTLELAEKRGVRCIVVPSEWGRLPESERLPAESEPAPPTLPEHAATTPFLELF